MEIPVGYAQANLRFTGSAMPTGAEITLGLDVSSYVGTPDSVAALLASQWNVDNVDARMTLYLALTEVRVKYGPVATGPTGVWTGSIPGTQSGDSAPPNTAALVRKLTDLGGRAGRGRFFFPGVSEANAGGGGTLDPTEATNLEDALNDWGVALTAADLQPVLLHSESSPVSTPTPVNAFSVDGLLATQRRRLRR